MSVLTYKEKVESKNISLHHRWNCTSPLGRLIKWLVPKWQSTEAGQINMGRKVTFTPLLWVSRAPLGHGPIRAWMVGKSPGNYLSFSFTHNLNLSPFSTSSFFYLAVVSWKGLWACYCGYFSSGCPCSSLFKLSLLRTITGHRLSRLKTSSVPGVSRQTVFMSWKTCQNVLFMFNGKNVKRPSDSFILYTQYVSIEGCTAFQE